MSLKDFAKVAQNKSTDQTIDVLVEDLLQLHGLGNSFPDENSTNQTTKLSIVQS